MQTIGTTKHGFAVKVIPPGMDSPPDRVQWPNVGSAGHVAELLGQVCEFLNIKE